MLALLVAGCGGGGSDSIDKAAFVEQANRICQETTKEMQAKIVSVAKKEPGANQDQTNLILMRGTVIPAFQSELEEIRALGIPGEGKPEAQAFLRTLQKAVDGLAANPANLLENKRGRSPFEPAELAGARYGLTECPIASPEAG